MEDGQRYTITKDQASTTPQQNSQTYFTYALPLKGGRVIHYCRLHQTCGC